MDALSGAIYQEVKYCRDGVDRGLYVIIGGMVEVDCKGDKCRREGRVDVTLGQHGLAVTSFLSVRCGGRCRAINKSALLKSTMCWYKGADLDYD